jgi:hypothetical protein
MAMQAFDEHAAFHRLFGIPQPLLIAAFAADERDVHVGRRLIFKQTFVMRQRDRFIDGEHRRPVDVLE